MCCWGRGKGGLFQGRNVIGLEANDMKQATYNTSKSQAHVYIHITYGSSCAHKLMNVGVFLLKTHNFFSHHLISFLGKFCIPQ